MQGIDREDAIDVLRRVVGLAPTRDCLPRLKLTEVARDLDDPLFVGAAPGDDSRLYVVEREIGRGETHAAVDVEPGVQRSRLLG